MTSEEAPASNYTPEGDTDPAAQAWRAENWEHNIKKAEHMAHAEVFHRENAARMKDVASLNEQADKPDMAAAMYEEANHNEILANHAGEAAGESYDATHPAEDEIHQQYAGEDKFREGANRRTDLSENESEEEDIGKGEDLAAAREKWRQLRETEDKVLQFRSDGHDIEEMFSEFVTDDEAVRKAQNVFSEHADLIDQLLGEVTKQAKHRAYEVLRLEEAQAKDKSGSEAS